MSYELRGLIAPLELFAADKRRLEAIELQQGLALLPITDHLIDALGSETERPFAPVFHSLSQGIASLAEHLSADAPVAYCEAEFFGSTGDQAAVVWQRAAVTLGPLVHEFKDDAADPPRDRWPINSALAALGANQGNATDLFDAIGLGRQRSTDEWNTQTPL